MTLPANDANNVTLTRIPAASMVTIVVLAESGGKTLPSLPITVQTFGNGNLIIHNMCKFYYATESQHVVNCNFV